MEFGYIFHRAWGITWRHKTLWLFGFLVSVGVMGLRLSVNSSQWERAIRELPPDVQRPVLDFVGSPYFTAVVIVLVLGGLALSVGLALLGALGRAALVDQVRLAEDRDAVSLRAGWLAGRRYLWPTFLIRLLLGLPAAVVMLLGALPVVVATLLIGRQTRPETAVPGFFALPFIFLACLTPAVCLSILLSIPLGVLQRLAVRACVLEARGVRDSLMRAWALLREHLGSLALVWLALLSIGIGVLLVIGVPLLVVAMPMWTLALLVALVSPLLFVVLALLIWLAVWLIGAAANSVAETFSSAVWTLVYRELTGLGLTGEETTQAV